MIRKKITSILASTMVFCFMVCASVTGVKADNSKVEMVDGSYFDISRFINRGYTEK